MDTKSLFDGSQEGSLTRRRDGDKHFDVPVSFFFSSLKIQNWMFTSYNYFPNWWE